MLKNIYYALIPSAAFLLILLNALYGHAIFGVSDDITNKYEIYVRLQPEWNTQGNILYDVTNSWYKTSEVSFEKNLENHNDNQLQYINDKSFVTLRHDFSNCQDSWQPILYRRAIDFVRHEIEFLQGKQLDSNPNILIYPDIPNDIYSNDIQELNIRDGFSQFIPICTSSESTSYDYSIKINDDTLGFDVYFVSSDIEQDNFHKGGIFHFYPDCYGTNKQSFNGSCDGVGRDSGLLVIIPDQLVKPLTKVSIVLSENNESDI